jgi:hypothetical protein
LTLFYLIANRDTKILLICDGLDEYGNEDDVESLFKHLEEWRSEFHNMKVIMTTRIRAGFPRILGIQHNNYVRLLPFEELQVIEFFKNYDMRLEFDDLRALGLESQEICKPLFCWMFAVMYSKSEQKLDLKDLVRSLIYQQFIDEIIQGRPRATDRDLEMYYSEEKRVRKIAVLKYGYSQIYPKEDLRKGLIIDGLKYFGMSYDKKNYTSYFYSQTTTSKDELLEFMHNTFTEYLLSEYYIESVLEGKPYLLDIGLPTYETILFFDGLLELIMKEEGTSRKYINTLIESFDDKIKKHIKSADLKTILASIAKNHFDDEQIFSHGTSFVGNLGYRYEDVWIHRWLAFKSLFE